MEERLNKLTKEQLIERIINIVVRKEIHVEPNTEYRRGSWAEVCAIVDILTK